MQTALRITTYVKPGGKIEITDQQLPADTPVEVIVLLPSPHSPSRRSLIDVLAEAPGNLAFHTTEEVDTYIREERDTWER